MDPTVVAAWIAVGVSVLTLAGTLAAQYLGYRATSRDAEKAAKTADPTAEEQRKQLDRTLTEQNQQLNRHLLALGCTTPRDLWAVCPFVLWGCGHRPARILFC
jgi:hypothetical protein